MTDRSLLRATSIALLLSPFMALSVSAQGGAEPCTLVNYDPTVRPDPEGKPTAVRVGIYVVEIDQIDNVEQSFRIDFFVILSWHDARLGDVVRHAGRNRCVLPRLAVWEPRLVLFNRRDLTPQLPDVVTVDNEGNARYVQRLYGDLRSPLDLRDFPTDSQVLPVTAISIEYGPDQLRLDFNEEAPSRGDDFLIPGWRVDDETHLVDVMQTRTADPTTPGERFARFRYTFHVSREVSYYIWRVIGPLTFIVCMSWAVFWIHPGLAAVQIGLGATSILTLIAFLFSLNNVLPPLSYLTRMDIFLFCSLALVFLAFTEAVATAVLNASNREKLALRFDRTARWLFPCVYILIHLVVWNVG
jgi:gamma-aminobutyric acid receptor subunit beta